MNEKQIRTCRVKGRSLIGTDLTVARSSGMTPLGSPTGRGVFSEVDGDEVGTSRAGLVEVEGVEVGVGVTRRGSGEIEAFVLSCGRSLSLPTDEEATDDVGRVRSVLAAEAVAEVTYCYTSSVTSKKEHVINIEEYTTSQSEEVERSTSRLWK